VSISCGLPFLTRPPEVCVFTLRATATVAFLPPTFLASRVPQAFSADQRET
jgi:hypothetical protein